MNVWKSDHWKSNIDITKINFRSGLRLHFQKGIDPEVKRSCIEFANWLRKQYFFPMRVPVYLKISEYVKTSSGELVSAIFFEPFEKETEPYITIATGDIGRFEKEYGKDEALAKVLCSLIHELTHYFQWINDVSLTEIQSERQALYYKRKIIDEYSMTREHP